MKKYSNITKFIKCNYLEYLLSQNITIVHCTINKSLTFLVYKDELFIFEGIRSLNRAYIFYNVDKELCDEGIEYYKLSKNYLNYMDASHVNIQNGHSFVMNKEKYLLNYISKGFKTKKNLSLAKLDKIFFEILEFCETIYYNKEITYSNSEKIAVATTKKKTDLYIDFYPIESIEAVALSNKYPKNSLLYSMLEDKTVEYSQLRIGIFFCDGYKDCITIEDNRVGGFLYCSKDNENLQIYKFETISLNDIYFVLTELFEESIPLSITTDNEFLYDVLKKSFINLDFILDKNNYYNKFIKELGNILVLNNFDSFKLDTFCMMIQNNFDEIKEQLENVSVQEFEYILTQLHDNYSNALVEEEYFNEELEEIQEIEEEDVDTKLFS